MEPDTIDASQNAVVNAASNSATNSASTPQSQPNAQGTVDRHSIRSFSSAVTALKRHSLENVTDFPAAVLTAVELHAHTHEIINTADISNLQAARDPLHPVEHYLAYVATLHATFAVVEPDSPVLSSLFADFRNLVQSTDPKWARAVPERWIGTARHVVRLALDVADTARALSLIQAVRAASDKLCAQPDELVALHADFLALCLHAKCYRVASQWISEHRRFHVDVASGLHATDVHLVYYYSALVLVGRKEFRAALQKCRLALTVPAPSPGPFFAAAINTYKMYILLHLLVAGTSPPPPKFTSYQSGSLRKAVSLYEELAVAYEVMDMAQLQQIIESNRCVFEKQGNLGIVKQLVESLFQKLISRLSNSYVTMTLKDVASKVGLSSEDNVHDVMVQMVDAKRLNASIDERENIVQLMDNDVLDEEQLSEEVSAIGMTQCLDIMTRIQRFREIMNADPEYIKRDMRDQGSRKGVGASSFAAGASALSMGVTELEAEFMR